MGNQESFGYNKTIRLKIMYQEEFLKKLKKYIYYSMFHWSRVLMWIIMCRPHPIIIQFSDLKHALDIIG